VQTYLEMMFASDVKVNKPEQIVPQDYNVDFDPTVDNCVDHPSYNSNEHRWGDARAKICHYELLQNGNPSNGLVNRGDQLTIRMSVIFEQEVSDLIYGITVKTNDGNAVYGTNSRLIGDLPLSQSVGDLVSIEYQLTLNLLAGDYFISLGVAQDHDAKDNIAVDRRYDLIHLHVASTPDAFGYAQLDGKMQLIIDNES